LSDNESIKTHTSSALLKLSRSRYVPFILFFLYTLILVVGYSNHEMWRDETRLWLLGVEAESIKDVHYNLRNEGHPRLLHYLCYFVLGRFSEDVRTFQLFHLLLAVIAGALVAFSRLGNHLKLLLLTSYYMLFEYAIVCRSYVLCVIGLWLFCCVWPQTESRRKMWLILLSIFLLTQSTIYGVLVAGVAAAVYLWKKLFDDRDYRNAALFGLISLVCAVLAIYQIIPQEGTGPEEPNMAPSVLDIIQAFSLLPRSILPLNFSLDSFWNRDFFSSCVLPFVLSISLIAFLGWMYWETKRTLFFTLCGVVLLLLFGLVYMAESARHYGHIFLVLVAGAWLFQHHDVTSRYRAIAHRIYFPLLLFVSSISGVYAYVQDYFRPFSDAQNTAQFIQERYDDAVLLQDIYFAGEPICAYLNKPMLFVALRIKGRLFPWDGDKKLKYMSRNQLEQSAIYATKNQSRDVLLILNYPCKFSEEMTKEISVDLVYMSKDAIVRDERYFVYRCTNLKSNRHSQSSKSTRPVK
jgi:hypothetical protein